MKRIICIAILVLAFASPAQAVTDAYIMVGASNAARGVAAASFESATGGHVINCGKEATGLKYILSAIPYIRCVNLAKGYNVIGILAINGEVETKTGDDWLLLSQKLKAKFEATYGHSLPMYHVRIHKDFPYQKYKEAVRVAQASSGWCWVDTDALTLDSNWHYDVPSAVIIGQRLAECR